MVILPGIAQLRDENFKPIVGKRVGLLTNPSAIDRQFNSSYDIFRQSPVVQLAALFGPEHGFDAVAPDATVVDHVKDSRTNLPIYSLYGETYRPTPEMLRGIDVLVCDIQDIGVRFYTYIWTVSYILEACGDHGVEVLILDRPNPLGDVIAGPPLVPHFVSFVGRFNVPVQHGMTLGELAQMINSEWNPTPAHLTIIPCAGWRRSMRWQETGLHFVTTSPAIPHIVTAQHYPGSCLIEGTRLSEGRGTALPFEIVGAPYIDGTALADILNVQGFAGVHFRPHTFMPTDSKYARSTCYGVQAHITDLRRYRPIETWLGVIQAVHQHYPDDFAWLSAEQQHYERGSALHFDRLIGSDTPRQQIEAGASLPDIVAGWGEFCAAFKAQRQPYLLYE